jgi:hypothetical protein
MVVYSIKADLLQENTASYNRLKTKGRELYIPGFQLMDMFTPDLVGLNM